MALSNAERQRRYRERRKQASLGPKAGAGEATAIEAPAPAPPVNKAKFEPTPLDAETIDQWLELIATGKSTRAAARIIGHDHRRLGEWRRRSEENERRYEDARETCRQAIDDELVRRGIFGYDEVTRNGKGEVIRVTTRHSDALAQLVAKANRPEVYRDNYQSEKTPTVIVFHSPFAAVMPQEAIEVEARELPPAEEDSE